MFVTEEDVNNQPVLSDLLHEDEEYGAILPDGSINWDCPCLGTYVIYIPIIIG